MKANDIDFTLESLSHKIQYSNEALSLQVITNFLTKVKDLIFTSGSDLKEIPQINLSAKEKKLGNELRKLGYSNVVNYTVHKPVGLLTSHYKEEPPRSLGMYREQMKISFELVKKILMIKIPTLTAEIEKRIANPSLLKAESLHNYRGITDFGSEISDIHQGLAVVISSTVTNTTVKFGELFPDINSFEDYLAETSAMAKEITEMSMVANAVKQVGELNSAIEKLNIRRQEEPDNYAISNTLMKKLSDDLMIVAKDIEFCGAFFLQMEVMIASCNNTKATLLNSI